MIHEIAQLLLSYEAWIALLTLTALELVLGIDNVIFITILADRLPPEKARTARLGGLFLAIFMRIGLLFALYTIARMTEPLFTLWGIGFSGRNIVLVLGGSFLIWKSAKEIVHELTPEIAEARQKIKGTARLWPVLAQIALIDLVFSLDSIITAVGMVKQLPIMISAIVIAVIFMMAYSEILARFIARYPTLKMLALTFLVLVGIILVVDGIGYHVPKSYIYLAMVFSLGVETLNIQLRKKHRLANDRKEELASVNSCSPPILP